MDKRPDEEKLKDIKSRFNQLEATRTNFVGRWSEAQQYVDSTVRSWTDLEALPAVPQRYSSDPCHYKDTLVSGLVGYSISPNINWFKLSLEDQKLLKLYGVKDFLEESEEILNAEFNRSNLYTEASKMLSDGVVIGHGVMLCEENLAQNKLQFTCISSNELFLDTNENGEVDTIYRKQIMTLRQAVNFFGLEKLAPTLQEDYKEVNNWNNKITILHAVFPRGDYNPEQQDSKDMPYASFYIDMTNDKIIVESGYEENPYAVFEWDQIPGLPYSTSPAMDAIPDIKYLNIANKTSMEICQLSAEPPMRVSESIRGLSIVPRGRTYVATPDEIIEPIRTGDNYPVTLQMLETIKQSVKDWFNVDFFLMLQQKQGKMTATEVMELQGEKSAVLSTMLVSLNNCLTKIIQRSFRLLYKGNKLPAVPQSLEGTNVAMKVDFVGPLAQAQKKYHTSGGVTQALQLASGIMQLFPNSGDYIDSDQLMLNALNGQGMPQNAIREEDDVKEIRKQRAIAEAQAQQQQQAMQLAQGVMQNADKMGNEGAAALESLNEQMRGSFQ